MTSAPPGPGAAWRPLRAVTLDLWGTLIDSRDPIGKIERRREMLLTAIRAAGHARELEELRAGFRAARRIIDEGIARDRRDVGPPGRWEELMRQLSIPPESVPFEAVTAAYEDLTIEFLPKLLDGVEAAVEQVPDRADLQHRLHRRAGAPPGAGPPRPDRLLRGVDVLERARLAEA
jgi:FMN phosphatase YigB (HAD superfamily)